LGSRPTLAGGVAKLMGEGRTVDAPLEAFRKSAYHGRRRRYLGSDAETVAADIRVGGGRPRRSSLRLQLGLGDQTFITERSFGSMGFAGAAGCLTSPRARMWLGEAPISLMLETSLIHPHTIVSMLINDLADNGNEVFLFLDDYLLVTDPHTRRSVVSA
jgi:hypothetical protein